MSTKNKTPVNQVRLTNVAIVRIKKGGKRFEIACYKNKVISWRNKVEKDLDEVLQSSHIFTNVSKGQASKKEDLTAAFGTDNEIEICKIILDKGELQVSDKERHSQQEGLSREIATLIANMCIDPNTERAHPVTMIEKGLHAIHFSVNPNRSAKQQALEAIPKLKEEMPIERARMRVRINVNQKHAKHMHEKLKSLLESVEKENWEDGQLEMIGSIDPGVYRELDDYVNKDSKGTAKLELLSLKQVKDGDEDLK